MKTAENNIIIDAIPEGLQGILDATCAEDVARCLEADDYRCCALRYGLSESEYLAIIDSAMDRIAHRTRVDEEIWDCVYTDWEDKREHVPSPEQLYAEYVLAYLDNSEVYNCLADALGDNGLEDAFDCDRMSDYDLLTAASSLYYCAPDCEDVLNVTIDTAIPDSKRVILIKSC